MAVDQSDTGTEQDGQNCEGAEGCKAVPTHIVAFDDMATKIKPFLDLQEFEVDFSHLQNQFDQVYVHLYKRG